MISRFFRRIFHGPAHHPDQLLHAPRIPYVAQYTLVAIGVGTLFPVGSMVYLLFIHNLPITVDAMVKLQQQEVLLWVIDSAPVVLAIYAFVLGLREDRLRETFVKLIEERENVTELQRLTRQLERRTNQLRAITQLSGRFSVREDLHDLLKTMLENIRLNFGYYHDHIYLLNE